MSKATSGTTSPPNAIRQIATKLTEKSPRERLQLRTREFAVGKGRRPLEINQKDYEQAKRVLTSRLATPMEQRAERPARSRS